MIPTLKNNGICLTLDLADFKKKKMGRCRRHAEFR